MASITFLSNAGVVLDLGGVRLMIDGIYNAQGLPFSDVPQVLLKETGADYLAFTHTHHDHLDQRGLEDYLAARPVRGLLLPPRVGSGLNGVPAHVMKGPEGAADFPGLAVRWYRTAHLNHAKPEHYSFVVKGGGATVLAAGDAMPDRARFAHMAEGENTDAMLVTPVFLQEEAGREIVRDVVHPRRLLIYHIPRAEDDRYGLRRMANRQLERWGTEWKAAALLHPGETVTL